MNRITREPKGTVRINGAVIKAQPKSDWYFYYSMGVGIIFTIILIALI